jgi:hypothetical protein
MGFGLPMLTTLQDMINEVANANNIPHDVAVRKFLNDMAENFSPVLGYEGKLTAIKSEIEKKRSNLTALSLVLDQKKEMAELLPLLILTGDQAKIDDQPSQCTPNYMQTQVASSAIHEGMNRANQNIGLTKEHVDSEVAGIENPVDVQRGMSHHMVIARMFPWNFGSVVRAHQSSIHAEDLEDTREMQELPYSRNTSNTKARAG